MRSFFLTQYRKHKKHLANMLAATAAAAGLAAGSAQATSISIGNPGFEINGGANYGAFIPASDSWSSSDGGQYIKETATGGTPTPYGTYFAVLEGSSNLSQTLGDNWAAGTYTLTGYGKDNVGQTGDPVLNLVLMSGALPTPTLVASQGTTVVGDSSLTILTPLIVTILPGNSIIGSPITVRLTNDGPHQVYADNIALNFEPVPEPMSSTLFVIGLSGLGLVARRKKA